MGLFMAYRYIELVLMGFINQQAFHCRHHLVPKKQNCSSWKAAQNLWPTASKILMWHAPQLYIYIFRPSNSMYIYNTSCFKPIVINQLFGPYPTPSWAKPHRKVELGDLSGCPIETKVAPNSHSLFSLSTCAMVFFLGVPDVWNKQIRERAPTRWQEKKCPRVTQHRMFNR